MAGVAKCVLVIALLVICASHHGDKGGPPLKANLLKYHAQYHMNSTLEWEKDLSFISVFQDLLPTIRDKFGSICMFV